MLIIFWILQFLTPWTLFNLQQVLMIADHNFHYYYWQVCKLFAEFNEKYFNLMAGGGTGRPGKWHWVTPIYFSHGLLILCLNFQSQLLVDLDWLGFSELPAYLHVGWDMCWRQPPRQAKYPKLFHVRPKISLKGCCSAWRWRRHNI